MTTTDRFGSQKIRRIQSLEACRADLYGGPNVVMPPVHLMASSEAHDIAIEMEMAKQHLDEEISSDDGSPRVASPVSRPPVSATDEFALAFDIDGVLIRGGEAIPEAREAMKYINGENPYGIKVYVYYLLRICLLPLRKSRN